jgi:hypothetical protein
MSWRRTASTLAALMRRIMSEWRLVWQVTVKYANPADNGGYADREACVQMPTSYGGSWNGHGPTQRSSAFRVSVGVSATS